MKWPRRPWHWFLLGIGSVLLITLMIAPWQSDSQRTVSSYSRTPDGYGAWYTYLQTQTDICVGRWHRPLTDLPQQGTLLRVAADLQGAYVPPVLSEWVNRGNTLIILGESSEVTEAPFISRLSTPSGAVKVDTRRRSPLKASHPQAFLGDQYGAVVWQQQRGNGRIIWAVTPYLGSNAYQDEPGNFSFLATLAQPQAGALWLDEVNSGYQPRQSIAQDQDNQVRPRPAACLQQLAQAQVDLAPDAEDSETINPWIYLLKTPWGLVVLQVVWVLGLLIIAQNRRFGLPLPLPEAQPDNTMAYIHALATVLHKARCHDFVVTGILKAEQQHVQQRLGLGNTPLAPETVLKVWEQMGYPRSVLARGLLLTPAPDCREQELVTWLEAWQNVRQVLSQPAPAPFTPAASDLESSL